MATKNVLGRIAAIVSVNTASVRPTLNASVKDIEKYATTVRSRISGATKAAGRAFDDIFTPLQKLQAALKAANQQPVDLKIQNSREILQAVRAAEQIAKPLTDARKQFSGLSQEVQATLLPVLQAAQKQTTQLFDALSNGANVSDRDLANTEARVRQLTASLARASEASNLTRGLATGQEVQFQNPEFVEQARRAAQLQQQAASLTPTQLGGSSIVGLIGQQRAAADEAERLRAALDKVRTTRNGDAQAAQAAYSNQLAQLAQINNRIELQIDLINRSAAAIRSAPQRQADNEIALLIRREQAAKEIEDQRQTAAQRVADNEIAQLIRREQAAKQIEQQRLAGLERVADNEIALLIRREQAAKEAEDRRLAAATRAADNEIAALIRREQAARRAATGGLDFGLDLDAPARQIEVLRGSVVSLKGQLDTLPAGIRSQFIPAIQQAEANLRALAASPAATAAELTRARREVEQLSQAADRARQSLNIQSFRGFTQNLATRSAIGELQALQGILARIQAQAGGPAAQAYDRYAAALRRAVREGTTQLPEVRRRLQELQVSAARAAAATGRISFRRALDEIRRGGDIARGGFNNLSLAAQQAAFAIDDFFSVQGDFTQRLRAVQNNITQLAFIIGGTRGLFIGLGVAIAAQATVAIINWINEGRTAEDQTKALNDALARQKSLVEELAQAFESLGDAIAEKAFSRSTQEARAFRKELDDLVKKQREAREAAIVDAAPGIGQVRADQNRISRELENEVNPGRRAALLSQLDESREAERRLANRAIEQSVPTGQDVRNLFNRIAGAFEANAAASRQRGSSVLNGVPGLQGFFDREARVGALPQNIAEILRRTDFGNTREATESQARALEDLRRTISPISGSRFLGRETVGSQATRAVELIRELEAQLRQNKLGQELDDAAVRIFESGNRVASRIEQAQNSVAEAIEAGIPGARVVEQSLNRLGNQLRQAFTDLEKAGSIADPTRRREAQDRIQERINTIQRRQRDEVAAADDLRRQTTLFPEQSIQNVISRIESGLSNLGGAGGNAQAELRRLQFERESIRQQRTAIGDNPFAARRLDIADAGLIDAIRSLEREVAELDETFNGFEARERDRFRGDAERGRELSLTPAQRAGEQLQQGLNDILARFGEVAENGNGLIDFQAAREAQLRFAADQNRAAAPAIFNLADSVQNAILQGPSRAALNASDISTQEGARELNRLLRGEDPARDNANLQELQRQSQILEENNRILREKLVAA